MKNDSVAVDALRALVNALDDIADIAAFIKSRKDAFKTCEAKLRVLADVYSGEEGLKRLMKEIPPANLVILLQVILHVKNLPQSLDPSTLFGPDGQASLDDFETLRKGLHRALDGL